MIYQREPVLNYPGYEIDNEGTAWSRWVRWPHLVIGEISRKLVGVKDKDGYLIVTLRVNGKQKTGKLHRLVAQAFIPNPEGKPQVCHRNGQRADNRVENLYWGTSKENIADSLKAKTHACLRKGEARNNTKLKNADIPLIRELLINSHISHQRIGEIFGVSAWTIRDIGRGKIWAHIGKAYCASPKNGVTI